jgi:hypothetical protein
MSELITADFETLVEQGPIIASIYLREAVHRIDDQFGDGYAEENPLLTGMFILASAIECTGATLAQQIRCGLSETSSMSFPDVAEELRSLAAATESIASAIEYK